MTLESKFFAIRAASAIVLVALLAKAATVSTGALLITGLVGGIVMALVQGRARFSLLRSTLARLDQARRAENTEEWDRLAKELFSWEPTDPELAMFLKTERGLWLIHHKKFDEALVIFEAAFKAADPEDPRRISRRNNIAWTLLKAGRAADAIPHARAAVADAEASGDTHFLPSCLGTLGGALVESGERAEGRAVLQRAIELGTESDARSQAIRHYFLARSYDKEDAAMARTHYEKTVQLAPETEHARLAKDALAKLTE